MKIIQIKTKLKPEEELKCYSTEVWREITTANERGPTIKRIDKNHYKVLSTGEVKEFNYSQQTEEEKARKLEQAMARRFNQLRRLIHINFDDCESNALFITLTYEKLMKSPETLYEDFRRFWQRLKHRLKEHTLQYIAIAEPQGRGAWHIHMLIKSDKRVLHIENGEVETTWGKGFVTTKRLKSDGVANDLAPYFYSRKAGDEHAKQKRERLSWYPINFRFFRCSRGIKKPDPTYIFADEIGEEWKTEYERSIAILTDEMKLVARRTTIVQSREI
jgi:hypothetical protein